MTRTTEDRGQKTEDRGRRAENGRQTSGSAIILAVVLTSLLAIIGIMFLLSSRVDSIATSAISENKDLNLAVDTVIAQISEELAWDVPRADVNGVPVGEYYDYPDGNNNPWLACLEPYQVAAGHYRWRQISNIYGSASLSIDANILPDYNDAFGLDTAADADGDGVSDSMWVQVQGKTSAKGKPIYAAVRIVDNGGMLNVNTGYKFDPCDPNRIDGSSQTQINFMALSDLDHWHMGPGEKQARLLSYRCNSESNDIGLYEQKVIWQYGPPIGAYTPFDISDELVLRNRYILNNDQTTTRIENLWTNAFKGGLEDPRTDASKLQTDPDYWFARTNNVSTDPCIYDYRHIATTYNLDCIINPAGQKMFNINSAFSADVNAVYNAVRASLDPNISDSTAAQITANLIDYVDGPNYPASDPRYDPNNNITVRYDSSNIPHFGFEQPCIYISEIAQNFFQPDANDPNIESSYAIELHKPYAEDPMPQCPNGSDCSWRLVIDSGRIDLPINWSGSSHFHVLLNNAYGGAIKVDFNDINEVNAVPDLNVIDFNSNSLIELRRRVYDPCYGAIYVTVDSVVVPVADLNGTGWLKAKVNNPSDPNLRYITHSFQRDITPNKPIRRLWDLALGQISLPTIGYANSFVDTARPEVIQAHPANQPFTNVGEFGQLFYAPTYRYGGVGADFNVIVAEPDMRINLADTGYQQVFKYLTVMDPNELQYGGHPYGETRIKGRININTAPWYVLAQLPWVSYHTPNWDLARSIVGYRDAYGAFKSTGELMRVMDTNSLRSMDYYAGTGNVFPALTPADGTNDYFEKRDAIFTRISNLVTVRSDVFTAYILVRVGSDGPQKRVVAILDRSEVPAKKVKVIAIQQVPDPR